MDTCSKRLWVLTMLSDDGLLAANEALPQGLAFHLSRCPSCRAVAEQLRATAAGLNRLTSESVPEGLEARAFAQARAALSDGARLTGRVTLPPEIELVQDLVPRRRPDLTKVSVAAAAAIVLFVSGGAWWQALAPRRPVANQPVAGALPARRVVPAPPEPVAPSTEITASAEPVTKERRVGVRRYHSHIEAAMSDDTSAVQSAVVLPDPQERGMGWVRWFDNP